jgi:hypothetical protein
MNGIALLLVNNSNQLFELIPIERIQIQLLFAFWNDRNGSR